MRSFCRAISAFSASSSLKAGSRNAKNVSHGSSLHKPQCSSCFVLTQQLYNGQASTFIVATQKGFPFCCPHPWHFSPKCSQVLQKSPHTAAKFLFTMAFTHLFNIPLFYKEKYYGEYVWTLRIVSSLLMKTD